MASLVRGPFRIVGETLCGPRQPRRDNDGYPIPGSYTDPSIADLREFADPAERAEIVDLLCSAPEVRAQRDDLARRLDDAIRFIEHGVGAREGAVDAAALRRLLDRDVLAGLPLKAAYGRDEHFSEASFDIVGARAAVALAQHDPRTGSMPAYTELLQMVERLAGELGRAVEDHIFEDPRDAVGSPVDTLVKQAYALIDRPQPEREDARPAP